jgi:hypothetical protein
MDTFARSVNQGTHWMFCQYFVVSRYLVTFSPLQDKMEDPQAIIIWDVRTGQKKRGFHCESQTTWPIFKWVDSCPCVFTLTCVIVLCVYEHNIIISNSWTFMAVVKMVDVRVLSIEWGSVVWCQSLFHYCVACFKAAGERTHWKHMMWVLGVWSVFLQLLSLCHMICRLYTCLILYKVSTIYLSVLADGVQMGPFSLEWGLTW